MRETGAAREFVRRPHVVPQVHRHHRQAMILGENDFKAILELVLFKFQLRHFEWRGLGRRRLRGRGMTGRLLRRF